MLYMYRFTYQYDGILQPTSERNTSYREIFQHEYENFLWHAQNKCALFYYCHKNLAWAPNPISGSWVKVTQTVTEP